MKRVPTWVWIVGLILLVVIGIPGAFWLGFDYKYTRLLEAEKAKLRALGVPTTMAEAKPKPVPEAQNAAVLYMKVFEVNFEAGTGSGSRGLSQYETVQDWKAGDMATAEFMRPSLSMPGCQEALQVLRQASLRPHSVFPVKWEAGHNALYPHMAQMRQATRLCAAQAMLDVKDGNLPRALDWLGVCYRMADHASQEPTLIAQLVSIAIAAIANRAAEGVLDQADLTPAQAATLQRDLDRLRLQETMPKALRTECAMGLETMAQMRHDPRALAQLSGGDSDPAGALMMSVAGAIGPYLKLEELNYLSRMSRMIERSRQPCRVTGPAGAADEIRAGPGNVMASVMVPVYARAGAKRDQALAGQTLIGTVLRLKAYRHEQGSYPATLAGLGGTVPEDVFSGQPLGYRRQGQGFLLYSIGPNLKDDGGTAPGRPGDILEEGDMVWECSR